MSVPRVVHRGDGDAIVVKPAGMSCEAPGSAAAQALLAWAQRTFPRSEPRLPHRLDRIACGLVVVALDADRAAFHAEAVRRGLWTKLYLARLAPGGDETLLGVHRLYLRRVGRLARVVRSGGQPSALEVIAVAAAPDGSGQRHALVRLLTGRYHQIRATLAHLGAPLAGDPLYGSEPGPFYLEHALLRQPRPESGLDGPRRTFHVRDEPMREPLDAGLHAVLAEWAARDD